MAERTARELATIKSFGISYPDLATVEPEGQVYGVPPGHIWQGVYSQNDTQVVSYGSWTIEGFEYTRRFVHQRFIIDLPAGSISDWTTDDYYSPDGEYHYITDTDYDVFVFVHAHAQRGAQRAGRWVALRSVPNLPLTGLARKILVRMELLPATRR